MIPWELIDKAEIPKPPGKTGQDREISPDSELLLYRRGDEYSLRVDNWELMNSRSFGSEQEIAVAACQRLVERESPSPESPPPTPFCVLVGGLGMGFTLRSALDLLPADSQVVVAELVPDVVRWNREHLGHSAGDPLDDPRVEIYLGDVAGRIRSQPAAHDAIILDVDNGPHAKPSAKEGWLYCRNGLEAIRRSLRPDGVLSIWSSGPSPGFSKRVERRGFVVEERECRGRGRKGNRHTIWIAQRTD